MRPDWVIEVVSPSSRPRDYIKKMIKYSTANVREYWIVDPEHKKVMVYGFEADSIRQSNACCKRMTSRNFAL